MNKIHNIIWSKTQNAWVVVAEGTKAASKAGGAGLKVMIALIMLSPAAGMASSLPQGGSISVGQGSIVSNGSNQMVIQQTTDKLGINWQSFNVGADGHVVFDQPGAHSIALNRVIGSDGSSILGKIDANGQVFLINPNGVIFGKDAKINVGGLVASTLNISDADFKAGNFKFTEGATSGEVANLGSIEATQGGYVALIGKSVKNNGVIKAKLGTAALAAGSAVTLDFSGDGLINIQVNESAVKAQVENKGLIKADGGSVLMTARASNALLDTVVNNEGVIEAKTIENRSGKIFLDGGFDGGTVSVAGTLDASAPVTGNGGFIETSGLNVKIANEVKVSTLAKNGTTGDWLIDPADFNINAGTGASTSNSIGATTLSTQLGSSNVTIATMGVVTPGQLGDINVNSAVTWGANTKLTLNAHHDINFKDKVTINGNTGGLVLNFSGRVNAVNGGAVKLNGASTTYSENGKAFTVLRTVTDLNQLTGAAASNKYFALGGDIDASVMSTWNAGKGFDPYGDNSLSVFKTVFNGLGNTISNFYVNRPTEDYVGLFGNFYSGTLSNLNMTGTVIGKGQTGMVAGQLYSATVYNVKTSGTISGNTQVGGVFGYAYANKMIDNVSSASNVTGQNDEVGGVIGSSYSNTMIKTLRYSGIVDGYSSVGGLIGKSWSDVDLKDFSTTASSSAKGDTGVGGAIGWLSGFNSATDISGSGAVEGNWGVGGAFGYAKGTLSNIKSDANVKGKNAVGGLIGEMGTSILDSAYATGSVTGTANSVGGLVGTSSGSIVSNTFATGAVTGKQDVGGLFGSSDSDQIKSSFSTSKVTGSQNVGGFGGSMSQSIITDAYATGEVSADTANSGGFTGNSYSTNYKNTLSTGKNSSASATGKGGFIGVVSGDVFTSSYWDTEKSGMTTSAGGAVGKTTDQLTHASTFAGWGISSNGAADTNAWRIYEGSTTPLLKFLMATADVSQNDIVTTYTGSVYTPVTTGQNNLTNVQAKSFFASLLDLTAAGLKGGDFVGSPTMQNAGNYLATSALTSNQFGLNLNQTNTGKVVINKAALSFNATGNNKVYDGTTGATSSLTALGLGSDVLTITGYNANFTNKNAGTGKTVNINGITISGAAASNYTWGSLTTTADIAKANLTIGATGSNKTYDGTTAGSVTVTDNRLGSDVLTISKTASFADKNAGTGKIINVSAINVTGADAANYNWNTTATATADIAKAALLIGAVGQAKVYDGTTGATVSYTDNRKGADVLSISSTSSFADKNAGNGKVISAASINVTGADAANYTWNNSAATSANITKANLAITAAGVNKIYDGSTSASVSLGDNRIAGDALTLSATASFSDKKAGVGKAVTAGGISVAGADAANYTWNSTALTTADISKANLVIAATASNKTYDGTTNTAVSLTDNRVAGDDLTIGSSASFSDKNAGAGKTVTVGGIAVSGADAANYNWNTSAATSANIAKANLAITAAGVNKVYDGSTSGSVNLNDNRIAGDDLSLSSTASFSDKNAGAGKAVTAGGISVTGADAANYTWNSAALTTADIGKANLSIAATGLNKTYDGTTSAAVSLTDNRVAGDNLTLGSSASFGDKNAGAGKTVTAGGITVGGADSANYTWNGSALTTADINKANLSVTATGANKTYDGTKTAAVSLIDNRVAGDNLILGNGSALFADKNAGNGKSILVDGISVSGADAGNYTWNSQVNTLANIAKANLVVSANASDKTYDGSSAANAVLNDNRIAGDVLAVTAGSSSFSDKNAATGKTVTIGGITLSGADANNYTVNSTATANASISKANLVVKAENGAKVEGDVDGQLKWSLQNGNLFGSDTLLGDLNRDAGEAAGLYGIRQGGLTAGSNYALSVVPGTFEIKQLAKPPIVIDPIKPPIVVDPVKPPVVVDPVKPPVVEPSKPVVNVNLEETKDIVSTVSVATKVSKGATETVVAAKTETSSVLGDYRLLNLGMKLPDDLASEEGATF